MRDEESKGEDAQFTIESSSLPLQFDESLFMDQVKEFATEGSNPDDVEESSESQTEPEDAAEEFDITQVNDEITDALPPTEVNEAQPQ